MVVGPLVQSVLSTTLTASQIRSLILAINYDSLSSALTLKIIGTVVHELAVDRRMLERKLQSEAANNLERTIREVAWEFVVQGIFAPGGRPGYSATEFPDLHITDYGRKCLRATEIIPEDPDNYLKGISGSTAAVDSTTLLYVGEALSSFRHRNYLSTAVMVGVAAESVLLKMVGAITAALPTAARKEKFSKQTDTIKTKQIHDAVVNCLRSSQTPFPPDLQDVWEGDIDGIFDIIRRTRNDSGHPKGRRVEQDEARALLVMFTPYSKSAHVLIEWLKINSI
jgi:hypothetical protein